jgi:ATP-dependent DNA ligase
MSEFKALMDFPSSSDANKLYTVKLKDGKDLTCNCMAWIMNMRKQNSNQRSCKHTDVAAKKFNITQNVVKPTIKGTASSAMPSGWVHPMLKGKSLVAKKASAGATLGQRVVNLPLAKPVQPKQLLGLPTVKKHLDVVSPMLAAKGEVLTIMKLYRDKNWVAEPKLDGARYVMYLDNQGKRVFSRHNSVYDNLPVEKTDNIPHITKGAVKGYEDTWIDGEVTVAGGDFGDVVSVMVSDSDDAAKKATTGQRAFYTVFDCMRFKGKDVTNLTYVERRKLAEEVVKAIANPDVVLIDQVVDNKQAYYKSIVAKGGEGIILKKLDGKYSVGQRNTAWTKVKKTQTYDVVVMGFEMSDSTSFAGLIRNVVFGVYKGNTLTRVGTSSGMSLDVRKDMSANPQNYKGKVCEIVGQEVLRDAIRHPRYIRMRPDANPKECTFEKLMAS